MFRKVSAAAVAAAMAIAAGPAGATSYVFTVGGTTVTGSGTLRTTGEADSYGGFQVTDITGTVGGNAITGLIAAGGYRGNDNLLFPSRAIPVDVAGISYSTAAGNALIVTGRVSGPRIVTDSGGSLITLSVTAVPSRIFDFVISGGASGSGTLTTDGLATADGRLIITDIDGSIGGDAITGLLAPGSFRGNDNLLRPDGFRVVDLNGVSFTTASGNENVYGAGVSGYHLVTSSSNAGILFSVMERVSSVPEPATWAMMLLGFGMVAGAARYRRRSSKVSFA